MVVGTDLILTGTYSATSVLVSLVPFFLVNNLLLLNQFPDRDADTRVGRRNMVIVLGRKRSAILYGLFNVLAFVVLGAGVLFNLLPVPALIAFVMAPVAWRAFHIALRNAEDVERLIPAMGLNVLLNLLTPVLIAVALLFAHIY
jgi:1,4-dihydroxy-2-naphthoate octaprenyltransferase